MKYVHIMFFDKFIIPYIQFINRHFEAKEHIFIVIDGYNYDDSALKNFTNVKRITTKNKLYILRIIKTMIYFFILTPELFKAKKIYIHGLFDPRVVLYLFTNSYLLRKSNWVMWGGDLYSYEYRTSKSLLHRAWHMIDNFVKKNFMEVSALVYGDYELAKKYYNIRGVYKRAIYMFQENIIELLNKVETKVHESLNIQIGHCADPKGGFEELLDYMLKYKDENIKIYSALSYGDKEYAKEYCKKAISMFGDKFIPLLDFMEIDEYVKHLNNIDILLFNFNRQQGLGNIQLMAYLNRKIFIKDNTTSWKYLKNEIGLEIYPTSLLSSMTYNEFKCHNRKDNKKVLLETIYCDKYIMDIWSKNFDCKNNM